MVPPDASPSASREDLPLPDYDHLPLASLIQRIRSLDVDQLSMLDRYERAHGNRLPVTEAFRARLAELESGAEPSGGSPAAYAPEKAPGPDAPRQTDQTTAAPANTPPMGADVRNPKQPSRARNSN
ncbi:MAG TPA: hypothetical protein VNT27_10315 [Propionibacteriaceae bacterium]|nr:hypothetical protein [Propionibacteriaceae bacterium]